MMKHIPLQTEQEGQLVKQLALLPVVLDVLERDIAALQTVPLKMRGIYVQCLQYAQDQATLDLSHVRKQLRQRGIKVYEQRRTHLGIELQYVCRGYEHQFSILWSFVKAEVERWLRQSFRLQLADEREPEGLRHE